ncbi:hypothetical protein GEMRC1_004756 [Eukaryota sp. GEM-RC1]
MSNQQLESTLQRLQHIDTDLENIEVDTNDVVFSKSSKDLHSPDLSINDLVLAQNTFIEKASKALSPYNSTYLPAPTASSTPGQPTSTQAKPHVFQDTWSVDHEFQSFIKSHELSDESDQDDDLLNDVQRRLALFNSEDFKVHRLTKRQRFRVAIISVIFANSLQRYARSSRRLLLSEMTHLFHSFSDRSILCYNKILLYPLQATIELNQRLIPSLSKLLFFLKEKSNRKNVSKIQTRMVALTSCLSESGEKFVEREKGVIKFLQRLCSHRKFLPCDVIKAPYSSALGIGDRLRLDETVSERDLIIVCFYFVYSSLLKLLIDPMENSTTSDQEVVSPFAKENCVVMASFVDYIFRFCGAELLQANELPPSIYADQGLEDQVLVNYLRFMNPTIFGKCVDNVKVFILSISRAVHNLKCT